MSLAMLAALALGRQVGATCVTLEARMCRATTVFQGVLVEDTLEELAPRNGSMPGNPTVWPDGFQREVLTIRVGEAWKGKPGKTATIYREGPGMERSFKAWIGRRTPVVWFVEKPDRWSSLRLGPPAPENVVRESGYGALPILSMRLDVLRTPDEVRRALQAFAPRARENPEVKMYSVTSSLPSLVGIWADAYGLDLPLVPEMVPTALRLIESPLSYVANVPSKRAPKKEIALANDAFEADWLRGMGADLLSRFKTPESVDRLKAMLHDRTLQKTREGKQVYPVRKAAYAILRGWGIKVAAPKVEEV